MMDNFPIFSVSFVCKSLLLFFMLLLFLQNNNAATIANYSHSRIEFLPGFQGPLPFYLQTGYIGVGENEEVQLFYYFIKSESKPEKDPILIWLSGGPGCSGFTALAFQIGPLSFVPNKYNGSLPTLTLKPNSWTKVANIIFLDQPVHAGFSYATNSTTFKCTDVQSCGHTYEFIQKWLIIHPEFSSNPFYMGGDSYAGLVVPLISQLIANGIEAGHKPYINLKGYLLGNPATVASLEKDSWIPYAHGMGLISDELFKSLEDNCKGKYSDVDPSNVLCFQDFQTFTKLISGINKGHILEPYCPTDAESPSPFQLRRSLNENSLFSSKGGFKCRVELHKLSTYWANDPKVQEALHVRKGSIERWTRCRSSIAGKYYIETFLDSTPYHAELSAKGYRSLIYSGDHDMNMPFQSTQTWIKSLNYSIVDDWRPWIVDGQVAGYTRSYSNQMTFATVKGAGHVAPEYKPKESITMFKRWISFEPL